MRSLLAPVALTLFVCACSDAPRDATATAAPTDATTRRTGCGGAAQAISQVQGKGLASPLLGQRVIVEAIVTARAPALGGVFVQEEPQDRDGDPLTSEALFLLTDPAPLEVGQQIRTEGVVTEHSDGSDQTITALTELGTLLGCGKAELPPPHVIEQTPLVVEDWEALEGMRVEVEPIATLLDADRLMRGAELLVSLDGRQFASTEVALPGDEARKVWYDGLRSRLLLDTRLRDATDLVQQLGLPSAAAPWRIGSELSGIAGIFSQRQGRAVIHLTQPPKVTQAERPTTPPEVQGELRIASFNTLNLFNGDGKGAGWPTPRGASDAREWQRQLDKHVAVLSALRADAVALMELENDAAGPDSAEGQLVKALNRALGGGRQGDYVAVVPPASPLGSDVIRVGMIYRKSRLELDGPALALTTAPFDDMHRPALLQAFIDKRSKEKLTLVANHFKSKGGCQEADAANRDREDGQGCYNAARVDAARHLAAWVREEVGDPAEQAVLLLGDFNAYASEDPIRLLGEQGFVRVRIGGTERDYSFVYDGWSGSLDHALASTRMRQLLGSAVSWHINADESTAFDYQADDPARASRKQLYRKDVFRSSDHDPLLIGLNLAPTPLAAPK